jgi:hypothetical protein
MPRCGQIVWSACLGLVWRGTRSDSARFMKCGQDYWMREEVKEAVSGASDLLYLWCRNGLAKAVSQSS